MTYNGTSAPVRRTVWEFERTDNPFVPALPAPQEAPLLPEPLIPAPIFVVPERELVPVPRKGVRA